MGVVKAQGRFLYLYEGRASQTNFILINNIFNLTYLFLFSQPKQFDLNNHLSCYFKDSFIEYLFSKYLGLTLFQVL